MYKIFKKIYHFIAGSPGNRNILNFKYLSTYQIYPDIKKELSLLSGDVVDFGCGDKPYKKWFKSTDRYVGVDMFDYEDVDVLVKDGKINLEDESFDVALSTQVFEHTESLDYLSELYRVLKTGGKIVITVPFLYHVHEDRDHRRFTDQGLSQVMKDYGFKVKNLKVQGGIGSTMTILFTSFIDASIRSMSKFFKIVLSPLIIIWYILFVPILNVFGYFFDKVDKTNRFYNNIIVVASK